MERQASYGSQWPQRGRRGSGLGTWRSAFARHVCPWTTLFPSRILGPWSESYATRTAIKGTIGKWAADDQYDRGGKGKKYFKSNRLFFRRSRNFLANLLSLPHYGINSGLHSGWIDHSRKPWTNLWIFQIGGNRWWDYVVIATVVITSVLTVANVERANLEPARFPP